MLPAVSDYDVIVVGAGNAALAAAVSAREQGAVAAGGQRPSLAHYVTGMGPMDGATAAGGRSCCNPPDVVYNNFLLDSQISVGSPTENRRLSKALD